MRNSSDLPSEKLLTITEATKRFPGRRPSTATIWRWLKAGCRGVVLESILIGGRRYTSTEAIDRFIVRTTAAAAGEQPAARTPKQREQAVGAAERELEAAGI
jgi:hypothetical protein